MLGVIAVIASQLLQASITGNTRSEDRGNIEKLIQRTLQSGAAAVICLLALAATYKFAHKYTPLLLVIMGAIAGQFIFIDVTA